MRDEESLYMATNLAVLCGDSCTIFFFFSRDRHTKQEKKKLSGITTE